MLVENQLPEPPLVHPRVALVELRVPAARKQVALPVHDSVGFWAELGLRACRCEGTLGRRNELARDAREDLDGR